MLILENHCWRSAENLRAHARLASLQAMRDELIVKMRRSNKPAKKRDLDARFTALAYAQIYEGQQILERQIHISRVAAPWFEAQQ